MLDAEVFALTATGSTNDDVKLLASRDAVSGTTVWSQSQSAGRGRQGNSWMSEPGNIFMSMLFRPETNAVTAGQLSFLSAIALARTVTEILPQAVDISLKWPNDLMLSGRKAAGILLESEMTSGNHVNFIVIGIGLNVISAPEGATSLKQLGISDVPLQSIVDKLRGHLISLYNEWVESDFDFAPLRSEWLGYAYRLGQEINVRLPQERFTGIFKGIDNNGALLVETPEGLTRNITSAEVFAL